MRICLIIFIFTLILLDVESTTILCSGGGIRAQIGCITALEIVKGKKIDIEHLYGISGGSWGVTSWKLGEINDIDPLDKYSKNCQKYWGKFDFNSLLDANVFESWKSQIKERLMNPLKIDELKGLTLMKALNERRPKVHIVIDSVDPVSDRLSHVGSCDVTEARLQCYGLSEKGDPQTMTNNFHYRRYRSKERTIGKRIMNNMIGFLNPIESFYNTYVENVVTHKESGEYNKVDLLEWLTSSSSAYLESARELKSLSFKPQAFCHSSGLCPSFSDGGNFCNIPMLNALKNEQEDIIAFDFSGYNSDDGAYNEITKCLMYFKNKYKYDMKVTEGDKLIDIPKQDYKLNESPISDIRLTRVVESLGKGGPWNIEVGYGNFKQRIRYFPFIGGSLKQSIGKMYPTFGINQSGAYYYTCEELVRLIKELREYYMNSWID